MPSTRSRTNAGRIVVPAALIAAVQDTIADSHSPPVVVRDSRILAIPPSASAAGKAAAAIESGFDVQPEVAGYRT